MRLIRYSFIIILILCLSGCMNVATTGAQAFYNRQSLQKNIADEVITLRIYRGFDRQNPAFRHTNVAVSVLNGVVLLTGQVPEAWQKELAGKIARNVPNVRRVYNYINISSPSSSLTRVSDAWITGKIKSRLLLSEDLDATKIKVVTENGNVYLMGMIFPEEANAAVDIARQTFGVQQVVKMFELLKIYRS